MVFGKLFEPFIAGSPVSVMFRGTLENLLAPERLDRIFENAAQKQTCRDLAFSTCADLLGMVVTRIRPSINAATPVNVLICCVLRIYGITPASM